MFKYLDNLIVPQFYKASLNTIDTEIAIKLIKDTFEQKLASALNLTRVSAPLFVRPETGLNDNLNGVERPVAFDVKSINGTTVEIVQSLAKWKRMALKKYNFDLNSGLYTDMNAIRRDEDLDNLHSIYVDQWDWEKTIAKSDRTVDYLQTTVKQIYAALVETEDIVCAKYPNIKKQLGKEIKFITTQELEDLYPNLTPKERENKIAKQHKAVFLMQIGGKLKSGIRHDGRSPDYDDWSLNGDILLWYETLDRAFEISSMGVRVDEDSLMNQLVITQCENRQYLPFHQDIINKRLPYSIGGGIGQSRLCMYLLQRAHIGEVQSSLWPDEMISRCEENNIFLL